MYAVISISFRHHVPSSVHVTTKKIHVYPSDSNSYVRLGISSKWTFVRYYWFGAGECLYLSATLHFFQFGCLSWRSRVVEIFFIAHIFTKNNMPLLLFLTSTINKTSVAFLISTLGVSSTIHNDFFLLGHDIAPSVDFVVVELMPALLNQLSERHEKSWMGFLYTAIYFLPSLSFFFSVYKSTSDPFLAMICFGKNIAVPKLNLSG